MTINVPSKISSHCYSVSVHSFIISENDPFCTSFTHGKKNEPAIVDLKNIIYDICIRLFDLCLGLVHLYIGWQQKLMSRKVFYLKKFRMLLFVYTLLYGMHQILSFLANEKPEAPSKKSRKFVYRSVFPYYRRGMVEKLSR